MHDTKPWTDWASASPWLPAFVVAVYAVAVVRTPDPSPSSSRTSGESPTLRWALFFWNFAMAVFSLWCTVVSVPHYFFGPNGLITKASPRPSAQTLIGSPRESQGSSAQSFVMSKFFELGDTAFLALRKRKLTNLHTFHHSATLVLTWVLFEQRSSTGLVFIA